ncbi:MAG: DUF3006 domain-containing protein [Acutalibacteraceae bacterium]|jgi:hypothetical protein
MRYVVDRLEEGFAVLQDDAEGLHDLPLAQLPPQIRPGDVVIETDGVYTVDSAATEARRQRILRLQRRLRRN